MHIDHVAVWTRDLDALCAFYSNFFGAEVGAPYHNVAKGFRSRFISFNGGARLEVMMLENLGPKAQGPLLGYAHFALSVGSVAAVDSLTDCLRAAGVPVLDGPRKTGDGYYESVVSDPDGNRVEITV